MRNLGPIRRVLVYTLALNLLVTAVKLAIGFFSGSLSVTADGFDSLLNSAANIVGLVGLAVAARPPDPEHPYGHRRFETLATVAIAVLIFATTAQLLQSAIARLLTPTAPAAMVVVTPLTFVAPLTSIAVQGYVAIYEYRRGRQYRSSILIADALHTRADVLVSVSVLAGLAAVSLGFELADPILAILIAGFIAYIGLQITRDSSRVLADAAAVDPEEVKRVASEVPGVEKVHRVRSRGQEDEIFVDLRVHVAPGMPVREAHRIAHRVEERLFDKIEGLHDAVVHIEPEEGPEQEERNLSDRIRQVAARIPQARVYGVKAHEVGGRIYVTVQFESTPPLPVEETHALAHRLQSMLAGALSQTAHVDVRVTPADEKTYQRARAALDDVAAEMGNPGDCYDLAVSQGHRLHLSARWECSGEFTAEQAEDLRRRLQRRLRERLPEAEEAEVHITW